MSTSSSPSSSTAPGSTPVDVFELGSEHEQVVFCTDEATGLRAIVAIHSTALGPALGGTRFYPYASTDAAVRDVLDLSRGMTYKAAVAGLDLGGREDLVSTLSMLAYDPDSPATVLVSHHVEEIPPGFTHALMLRQGRVVAAGLLDQTVTEQNLSATFGMPLTVSHDEGRWAARRRTRAR